MDPQQQFFQALSALRAGDLDSCESICKTLLSINPREVNTLRLNAQVLERRGDLSSAVTEFKKLLNITPDFAHAWADLGRVQHRLGELEKAEQSLRRALHLDAKLKAPAKLLQGVLAELGKTEQSAEVDAINRRHAELKSKVQQAFQLNKDGDASTAEKLCREVLAVDTDNVGAIRRQLRLRNRSQRRRCVNSIEPVKCDGAFWIETAHVLVFLFLKSAVSGF